jgi:hypothetical protein
MEETIWASTDLIDLQSDSNPSPPAYMPTAAPDASGVYAKREVSFATRILRILRFGEMEDRANRIELAFPSTFLWLFDKDNKDPDGEKGRSAMSFREWLVSQENSVFWITVVPASGKSTLMKFLTTHPSLRDRLKEWAGDDRVHIATFYFWNPGSRTQKSRNGLLRSLLHQLLSQRPELAETVARRRRLFFDIAPDNAEAPTWEWTELRECLFHVASHLRTSNSRLALFIDGLDEYEGFVEDRPATHRTTDEMVDVLMDLRHKYDAKLCISSRP